VLGICFALFFAAHFSGVEFHSMMRLCFALFFAAHFSGVEFHSMMRRI